MPDKGKSAKATLAELQALRTDFSRGATRRKLTLLRSLRKHRFHGADQLIAFHDLLLFVLAYPDSETIRRLAQAELQRFPARVTLLKSVSRSIERDKLTNSGLVDTEVSHLFSYDLTQLLCNWYPGQLDFDWPESDEEDTAAIFTTLPLLVAYAENDTLDNAKNLTTAAWLRRARGYKQRNDLTGFLDLLSHSRLSAELQRHLYDNAGVVVRWKLGRSQASRTRAFVPTRKFFYQQEPILPRTRDLRTEILSRPAKLRRLPAKDGNRMIRIINEALAVRYRELYPITEAGNAEVYCAEPGRGLQIFLFGTKPEFRLPLEANFGAMLVRNGVIVGYGVGACLLERVELAINIFPAFRTGESSFAIEQFFKLFHHYFGSSVLLVRSRQVGDGDDEPIQSGAFWFYYKLGFRPVRAEIRRLADVEAARLAADPSRRSSVAMLKRLSKSDVFLDVTNRVAQTHSELPLVDLGYVVTDFAARQFNGNRERAGRESTKELRRWLRIRDLTSWSTEERRALDRLGILLASALEIKSWKPDHKRLLTNLIRAKGGLQERQFVLKSISHPQFSRLLHTLARKAGRRSAAKEK